MATLTQLTIPLHLQNTTTTTLFTSLSSCTTLTHLKQVHTQIIKLSHSHHSLLLKLLISSFNLPTTTPSSIHYALSVFSQIPTPPSHISNKFLRTLSRSNNHPKHAFKAFVKMRMEGLILDRFSFPPILKTVDGLFEGMQVHGIASKLGVDSDPFVQTGLVGMYAACGRIVDARLVFDKMTHRDVVSWSIMIDGYCQNGLFDDVLKLFDEMMISSNDVQPDEIVLSKIVSACARAGNLSYGKMIHEFVIRNNLVIDAHLQSALITMYANCGCMDMAKELFDKMPKNLILSTAMVSGYSKAGRITDARLIFDQLVKKDLVCWSAMISAYAESDRPQEALNLFREMQDLGGMHPDQVTMLSVISACANLGALDQAKSIHLYIDENGFAGDLRVNNAIVDMYAKCGSLERAREVFEKMRRRNVISWTSMINAFAVHGDASNALNFFHRMKDENIEPNWVTFVGVLYACSHAGLVEEGKRIFASMINEHKITPKHEHYGCMVDLFGRANLLREALELVETMPLAPNVVIWGSLMAACRVHGEMELGEFAAKQLLRLDPDHDGALVLLSNIYAKEKKWQHVGEVRKSMKQRGILKERGCSRIEMNNEIHEFLMADKNHKQADQIYEKLDEVVSDLKLVGYIPNTHCVLVDLEEDEKKEAVLWHSEKLALCYGLMTAAKSSSIHIVKNLRVCEDCHTFIKLVSKVYEREIIVRDRTRFHHYKDGVCSCKDYW